ncbi:MAG: monovalent cation/H+ antiporter complex subunit F [Candidatus Bipolaricaulota bacterium]
MTIFFVSGFALTIFMIFGLLRIGIGPTVADRLVGLDTINTLIVAGMVVLGAAFEQVIYIDVAIVYALLSFIGTLYISKYLEGGI